jgi:hypothetical protein
MSPFFTPPGNKIIPDHIHTQVYNFNNDMKTIIDIF